ncbi:MAG: hypothetical protein QOJ11_285 [Frankiales bacterium]|nr:hypothetical protein [Frankiales bacterium]
MDRTGWYRWALGHALAVDGSLAVALSITAQLQVDTRPSLAARLLLLVTTGVIAWRRRGPVATVVVMGVAVGLMAATPQPPSVSAEYFAVMIAAFTVAERRGLASATAGGLALAAGIVLHDLASSEYDSVSGISSDLVVPALIWGLGRIVHVQNRRADRSEELVGQLEADREEVARIAVAGERAHLARELHDVVTHSISVVVIQAQGALRVLDGGDPQVRRALEDIESAGRAGLTDMRRLLGLLRDDEQSAPHAPQPGLDALPALVDRVRQAGLAVRLDQLGERGTFDPGLELSAYRIVQEALTNALKYAPGAAVHVEIRYTPGDIDVRVIDDGGGPRNVPRGSGRGLLGMRERVSVYGGELTAGPGSNGGFEVHARLSVGTVRT